MQRQITYLLAAALTLSLLTSCGGVASNPTSPNFNQPGQGGTAGQQGAAGEQTGLPGLPGQVSGGGAAMGEQILEGTYDTLWPQGLSAMEGGQVVNAAQCFKSALAQDSTKVDAALAYAVSDVMRDHRRYSVFLHPGVDKLFMNTPLIGHAEVFPNPFLPEDSYFLRLAALGYRTRKLVPMMTYPILAPVDTELFFTPDTYLALSGLRQEGNQTGTQTTMGGTGSDAGGNTVAPPGGGPPHGPQPPAPPPPGGESTQGVHKLNLAPPKPADAKQGPGPGTGSGSDTDRGGNTPPGGTIGGLGFGLEGPAGPPKALPERDEAISELEWETLLSEYRDGASRDGADMFLCANFYENLRTLHEEVIEHITNLENVRSGAEAEGYSLSLPFNSIDGTKKVTMALDVDDYHLILDYFKLLDVLLSYVEAYNHELQYMLPTDSIADMNGDQILTPDEYLPDAPFGTLDQGGKDTLGGLLPAFTGALTILNNDMRPLLQATQLIQAGDPEKKEIFYLSSFHRNYILIEEWTDLVQSIGEKSSGGTAIKLASGADIVEAVAVYDALFVTPLEDIRGPLPSYDFATRALITDEEGKWSSDPTFGGFFPEGLSAEGTYSTAGRFSAAVYDEQMGRAVGDKVNLGDLSGDVGETGLVTVNNALINELTGTPFAVFDKDGEEVGTGAVRTLFEVIPLFDVAKISMMLAPMIGGGPEGMIQEATGATGTSAPAEGVGPEPTPPAEGAADQNGEGTGGNGEKPVDTDGEQKPA